MKKSQTFGLKISEVKERGLRLPETATAEEQRAIRDELTDLEAEYRAALQSETETMDGAGDTPENRELQRLRERADVGVMLGAALVGGQLPVGSAEAEARAGFLPEYSAGNVIPFQMLAEQRSVDIDIGGGTQQFLAHQFPAGIATFANIARPSVPAGTPAYPSFTATGAVSRPAEGVDVADADPTLRAELLIPQRIRVSTKISVEDRARYPNFGAAVAAHLRAAVTAGLDDQALKATRAFLTPPAAR